MSHNIADHAGLMPLPQPCLIESRLPERLNGLISTSPLKFSSHAQEMMDATVERPITPSSG